jgi:hypothetical protein
MVMGNAFSSRGLTLIVLLITSRHESQGKHRSSVGCGTLTVDHLAVTRRNASTCHNTENLKF